MTPDRAQRKLAAILAGDVVEYSRLMEADEDATIETLGAYRQIIDELVADHRGRVFGSAGDSVIAEFASPVEAVRCAVEIQRRLETQNASLAEDRRMRFRIGVNLGDVRVEGDDLLGDGVNVAARLEGLAEPGGICVSATVHEHVADKLDLAFDDLGEQKVKNIKKPVRVYQVRSDAAPPVAAEPGTEFPELPDQPSIAVLPFDNLSDDPEQEYFADGITEEIITALARLPGFFVIARNSTFTYKGKAVDVKQVARELGVRYVLEGSVRTAKNKVRITAQLIDSATGSHVWAEKYDGDLADVFAVQDDITHKIVSAISPELTLAEAERLKSQPPQNLVAWQCVSQSLANFYPFTEASLAKADSLARKAIELDEQNAEAHALLALMLWSQAVAGFVTPGADAMVEASQAAQRAIALDNRSARAHGAMGITLITQLRYDEAYAESERAVELEPGSAEILQWSAFILTYAGPHELAVERALRALRLNPRDPQIYSRYQALAASYYALGHYEEALTAASRVARLLPDWSEARTFVLASLGQLGHAEPAKATLDEVLRRWPHYTVGHATRRHPFRDQEVNDRLADGLRKAGVPE